MTTDERQPMLFADLPIPSAPPQAPPSRARRRAASARPRRRRAVQMALDFDAREFAAAQADAFLDDGDSAWDFPQHRRSVAGHEPPPATNAVASIFALATAVRAQPQRRPSPQAPAAAPPLIRVEREAGCVRVVRLRPDETEEWAERERQRRARQRPPRPPKAAKTRGKKVRQWDGEMPDGE